ncbi:MAG: type 1 glutamine amidotransferase [Planctomycetota bacterium]|jgi:GMP synthase-like glutamine amidotransferase
MAILILQHDAIGIPCRLGQTLRDHAHKLDIRRLDKGDDLPSDLDGFEGVVSMGGHQDVGDGSGWMPDEAALLRAAQERDLPVVGICLGAQMIADALGGSVAKMETPEVGFHGVSLHPTAQTDCIFAGIGWDSPQFQFHGCEVTELPEGAQCLASSERCRNQVFRVGMRTMGFQFHFEADRILIADLCQQHGDEMLRCAGVTSEDIEQQAEEHYARFARWADRLCLNIAHFLMPSSTTVAV